MFAVSNLAPLLLLISVETGNDPVFENVMKPVLFPCSPWTATCVVYRFVEFSYIMLSVVIMLELNCLIFYITHVISSVMFWLRFEADCSRSKKFLKRGEQNFMIIN